MHTVRNMLNRITESVLKIARISQFG